MQSPPPLLVLGVSRGVDGDRDSIPHIHLQLCKFTSISPRDQSCFARGVFNIDYQADLKEFSLRSEFIPSSSPSFSPSLSIPSSILIECKF
jgi:hypothetical protein